MAKYSTGTSGGGSEGGTCELCGTATEDLEPIQVEGATLSVCPDCRSLGEQRGPSPSTSGDPERDDEPREKRAARNAAKVMDAAKGDSSHWEEGGTDYESDRLPYLVEDYGERVTRARQDAGYQRDELAAELSVDENDLLAVEQGRATSAGVGGSLIRAIEASLEITLVEE